MHEPNSRTPSNRKGGTAREWIIKTLIAAFAIATGGLFILLSQARVAKAINWETPIGQFGLALVITGVTFVLIDQWLEKGNREYLDKLIEQTEEHIRGPLSGVQSSLEELKKHNQILGGAIERGVQQIYARRSDGLRDLMDDLRQSKHVRMLGISLREYFVPAGHHYRDMEEVLDSISKSADRTIQILVLDPYSEQATIRAERESDKPFSEQNRYEDSGLFSDVQQSINYLKRWEEASKGHIVARVYNSAPTCFLVITDRHTYIEQYHYGMPKAGLVGGNFPLLKFPTLVHGADDEAGATSSVARHLCGHFDYIWKQAGTHPLAHLKDEHNIGVSKSAWECRLKNLFSSRDWAEDRIKYLISHEPKEIKLIGISLRDFLHAGKELYNSIQEASTRISVKALMLDPLSEQGRLRSAREEPGVDNGNLFHEVNTSIRSVERLRNQGSRLDAKLYFASTNCFAILTSESVIVEQYHYGSAAPGATILGGRVPVFEYARESTMYVEMEGHFEHIWSALSIDVEEWRRKHPPEAAKAA